MKKYISGILGFGVILSLILSSCSDTEKDSTPSGSNEKIVSSFTFDGVQSLNFETTDIIAVVSEEKRTITYDKIPFGVSLNGLVPTIEISDKATISPASGVPQDFSSPVTYTITSENGTKKVYVVTIKNNTNVDFSVYASSEVNLAPDDSLIVFGRTFGDYHLDKVVLTNNATIQHFTFDAYAATDSTVMFKMSNDLPLGVYSYSVQVGNQFISPSYVLSIVEKPSSPTDPFISSLGNSTYKIGDKTNNNILIRGKNLKNGTADVNINFIPKSGDPTVVKKGVVSDDGTRVVYRLPDDFVKGDYYLQIEVDGVYSNQFTASVALTKD